MQQKKIPIITICGSMTRHREEIMNLATKLSLAGYCVLHPVFISGHEEPLTEEDRQTLREVFKRKIAIADIVLIANYGSYLGKSSKEELDFARKLSKRVRFVIPTDEGFTFQEWEWCV